MEPTPIFLILAAAQAAVLLYGLGVVLAFERVPRVTVVAAGVLLLAGFTAIGVAGSMAVLLGGIVCVSLTLGVATLLSEYRNGPRPATVRGWGQLLLKYLGACWVWFILCEILFAFAMLATAPPGTLR